MGKQFKLFAVFIITTKLCLSQVFKKIPNQYFGFNDLVPSFMTMTNVSSKVLEKNLFLYLPGKGLYLTSSWYALVVGCTIKYTIQS